MTSSRGRAHRARMSAVPATPGGEHLGAPAGAADDDRADREEDQADHDEDAAHGDQLTGEAAECDDGADDGEGGTLDHEERAGQPPKRSASARLIVGNPTPGTQQAW